MGTGSAIAQSQEPSTNANRQGTLPTASILTELALVSDNGDVAMGSSKTKPFRRLSL